MNRFITFLDVLRTTQLNLFVLKEIFVPLFIAKSVAIAFNVAKLHCMFTRVLNCKF